MSVTAANLVAPNGPIEPDLFPGENATEALIDRLNAFIQQAQAQAAAFTWTDQTEEDAAVTAYALYLAFRQAHTLSLARPAEENTQAEMLGSITYTSDQRKGLKDLADWYWGDWVRLSEAAATDPNLPASTGIPSHQSAIEYDW